MSRSFLVMAALAAHLAFPASSRAHETASCIPAAVAAEREFGLPRGLVVAMSLTESGRNGVPQPFALNVAGRAHYPASATKAAALLRDDKGTLRDSATVGCMQLVLGYHLDGFSSVEAMLDPHQNVRYGARYLADLEKEAGSLAEAIRRYNGAAADRAQAYLCRVLSVWKQVDAASAAVLKDEPCPGTRKPVVARAVQRQMALASVPTPPRPPARRAAPGKA